MAILTPVHQFEIRFVPMLNFLSVVKEKLPSFVAIADNIGVDNENDIMNARYTFGFEKDNYRIVVAWDRCFIRYEGPMNTLIESNSIIETPFLSIFDTLRESDGFVEVKNYLLYCIYLNLGNKSKEQVVTEFSEKYYNIQNINIILGSPDDCAVVLEKKIGEKVVSLTYGPYLGKDDLSKRGITPTTDQVTSEMNKFGEIADVKIHENVTAFSFAKYKEVLRHAQQVITNLWA